MNETHLSFLKKSSKNTIEKKLKWPWRLLLLLLFFIFFKENVANIPSYAQSDFSHVYTNHAKPDGNHVYEWMSGEKHSSSRIKLWAKASSSAVIQNLPETYKFNKIPLSPFRISKNPKNETKYHSHKHSNILQPSQTYNCDFNTPTKIDILQNQSTSILLPNHSKTST